MTASPASSQASCQASDDVAFPLGDARESSVARALDFLAGRPVQPGDERAARSRAQLGGTGPARAAGAGAAERRAARDAGAVLSPRLKRQLGFGLLLLALLGLWAWLEWRERAGPPLPDPKAIETAAAQAGTAIRFRMGGRTIRLAGIDAPELRQACANAQGGEWPCGREAKDALAQLIAANGLQCEERATDRYRRALAICRTEAGDVGEAMVRAGLALGARDPRFDEYPAAMAEARDARRGLWQGRHVHPADWRTAHPRQPNSSSTPTSP